MKITVVILVAALLSGAFWVLREADPGEPPSAAPPVTMPEPPVDSDPEPASVDPDQTTTIDLGGGARLIIPPGAMAPGTVVNASYGTPPAEDPGPLAPIAHPVELTTDPPDAIRGLLTLEFPVPDHYDTDSVGISTFDEAAGEWTPVTATIDEARGMVVAQIEHFSWWNPFSWDWVSIGARVNQRIGQILGKRAPAATCNRGQGVPGWVNQVVGVSNEPAIAIRGCSEGEGDVLVVELVNNRPYSMYLEYGAAVAWGWREDGESGLDKARNALGDRFGGPGRLYLPPKGRASVGITKMQGHATFSAGFGWRSTAVDVLTSALGEAVEKIPGAGPCVAGLFATPFGEFSVGRLRDASAELFRCVQQEAAAAGYFDSMKIEQLEAYASKLRVAGKALVVGDITWNVADLFVDGVVIGESGMGAGFSVLGRSTPAPTPGGAPGPGPTTPSPSQPRPLPTPAPSPPPSPTTSPAISLSRGGPAPHGWWYSVTLSGFAPGSRVTLTCRDSVDPQGFWTQDFVIDGAGRAGDSTLCYSADGPDHWVTGGGRESNRVRWTGGAATPSPAPPPPPAPAPASPSISLSRGGPAPHGWWYSVTLSGFAPGSRVTLTCRDSVDPQGFWTQDFVIDGAGRAGDSTLCYSADGPDHWVTGGGRESNRVRW